MRVSKRNVKNIRKSLVMAILAIIFSVGQAVGQSGPRPSTGMKPLTELAAETYKGFPGGLYPGALNVRPRVHDSVGQVLARQIKPLSQSGLVDQANGKIVLLSIGMSNTTQEFSAFRSVAQNDPARNPRLTIVDGAQGGQTAAIISNGAANFWTVVEQRLASAGVTTQQVQVVWLKEADAGPTQAFPAHAITLQRELETIARLLKAKYPNLTMTYISSRIYGGYATTTLNPEPYAYESGFSVKWLIEKQIGGDTSLSYGGLNPRSPWLAWGPYLWSDGMIQRADGLVWDSTNFQADGTHPSSTGQAKVANLLLNFFKSDPTASQWFLKPSATAIERESHNSPQGFSLYQNFPNPFSAGGASPPTLGLRGWRGSAFGGNPSTAISYHLPAEASAKAGLSAFSVVKLSVFDVLGREVATLVNERKEPGSYSVQWNGAGAPSGIYLYRLTAGDFVQIKRMVLMR